jgi:hypothetical protein
MTDSPSLAFLSPSRCEPGTLESPMRRALAETDLGLVEDLWLDGKVELRGDLELVEIVAGERLVRLSPRRGLLLTSEDPADRVGQLRAGGLLAYDATGALAGIALTGERAMRRLTDLDLDALPAAGPFANVPAVILRDGEERFRVYVAQELGHYVAEAVLDALAGLEEA